MLSTLRQKTNNTQSHGRKTASVHLIPQQQNQEIYLKDCNIVWTQSNGQGDSFGERKTDNNTICYDQEDSEDENSEDEQLEYTYHPKKCSFVNKKGWECGREAMPNKEYCTYHIHRPVLTKQKEEEEKNSTKTFEQMTKEEKKQYYERIRNKFKELDITRDAYREHLRAINYEKYYKGFDVMRDNIAQCNAAIAEMNLYYRIKDYDENGVWDWQKCSPLSFFFVSV
eukprot:TRINITY_DN1926_c1_g1_i2.p1 TRINITY_DN1926_c1_g1~~TRINITY_DN1926_c1_g1_i2.p1  ORF type:complete len:251 (+),score=8.74 TRINITY_DN1926_c1_g1_i2:78-755(+)